MSIHRAGRFGLIMGLAGLAAGCSVVGLSESERRNDCAWNKEACMYEGSYEPGEREYAEQEARRLNREAAQRLRRSSGR